MRKKYLNKTHLKNKLFSPDKLLFITLFLLGIFGLLAVFNSSIVSAYREFGNEYYFVQNQAIFLILGFILTIIISQIDYHIWYKLSVPLLFITLLMLVVVFVPGIGVKAYGAKRWINIGFFSPQPTELTKLVLVIYLSAWFSHKEKKRFLAFLTLLGVLVGLVILQPDLGTAVIISAIAILLYFISGAPLTHFLLILPISIIAVIILAIVSPYRLARITTFINPKLDPLGSSYHIGQILIALGSGGWFGLGLGKSRQKYEYLPEANTDSIFAIIAEEIGFLGSLMLIFAFIFVSYRTFKIAKNAPDRFGQLLANGVAIWFTIQTIINLASMVSLIPLTGVPLPLMSYGGSNLLSILIGFGIVLNISKYRTNKTD